MASRSKDHILVVDDAPDTLEVLQRNLSLQGYSIFTARAASEAIGILENYPIDLVITDYKMPRVSGLDLIRHVRQNYRDTEVMMITGYATIGGAVEAVKSGAEEYLAKPFTDEELQTAVEKTLDRLRRARVGSELAQLASQAPYGLVGESKPMRHVLDMIEKAATTSATVLITGESGTGKELVARAIHYRSKRASGPFVAVNCGGIPDGLLESELFGHVKGAFTGAVESRAGFFQTAAGGTILLDEISELGMTMQVKLLRTLQDKEVSMVGATTSRKVDVRIVASTNKNLQAMVGKGLFREDLFFRLNVIIIELPPLRERGDDVLLLTHHFARRFARELDRAEIRFSDGVLKALRAYDWPGNVRELENLVQRVAVMTGPQEIDIADLPSPMRFTIGRKSGWNRTLAKVEAEHIRNVLAASRGNKSKAAEVLGIDRKTLHEKLKRIEEKDEQNTLIQR